MLNQVLIDYYKCPEENGGYIRDNSLQSNSGYFRFGDDIVCFGQCAAGFPALSPAGPLVDAAAFTTAEGQLPWLPFDPKQVIENLRLERYATHTNGHLFSHIFGKVFRNAYYGVRPILPIGIRRHFQRAYLHGRLRRPFPRWPVDSSVEVLLEKLLVITMKTQGVKDCPFIWFWPKGASACAIMTHDVETPAGRDLCLRLMDIDDEYAVKASFQIVPEGRYSVPEVFLETIRQRGFEVNVHDLNHDGQLYSSEAEFLRRVKLINQYGRQYHALGFRSAVLYRRPDWFHALGFNYDMSIPNVAHMDPQAGGCCTVFPYFIGNILEMPVTMTQDYTLFQILGQYSLELWKRQMQLIQGKHGLISYIIHPDYVNHRKAGQTYRGLLAYLAHLRSVTHLWIALPREVDQWWRARSQMRLVHDAGRWRIEGPEKERAVIAYAHLDDDRIIYTTESSVPLS